MPDAARNHLRKSSNVASSRSAAAGGTLESRSASAPAPAWSRPAGAGGAGAASADARKRHSCPRLDEADRPGKAKIAAPPLGTRKVVETCVSVPSLKVRFVALTARGAVAVV